MVTNIQYTNIRRVLDDITDHPLLRDVTLEQVIRHTTRFISLHGYPQLYQDKMQYVKLCIDYSDDIEKNGGVQLYAIPSATSEDVKKYPAIDPITSVDIDTFLAD